MGQGRVRKDWPRPDRTIKGRTRLDKTMTGQDRAGENRAGQVKTTYYSIHLN